jgi:hypothetical protein
MNVLSDNVVFLSSKEDLSNLVQVAPGESIWIIGSLSDSFENQIFAQMDPGRTPLVFEELVTFLREHGFTIHQTETHRELVLHPLEWVAHYPSSFQQEFLTHVAGTDRIAKQVLMQVKKNRSV